MDFVFQLFSVLSSFLCVRFAVLRFFLFYTFILYLPGGEGLDMFPSVSCIFCVSYLVCVAAAALRCCC